LIKLINFTIRLKFLIRLKYTLKKYILNRREQHFSPRFLYQKWHPRSISSTFYAQILHTKVFSTAFSTYMQLEKICQKDVVKKDLCVKCWWNWHPVRKKVFFLNLYNYYVTGRSLCNDCIINLKIKKMFNTNGSTLKASNLLTKLPSFWKIYEEKFYYH